MTAEQTIYAGRIHWSVFLPSFGVWILCVCFGVAGRLSGPGLEAPFFAAAAMLFLAAILLSIKAFWDYYSIRYSVTNKRFIIEKGILSRDRSETLLRKIESVTVNQGPIGMMIGYGTIGVVGTGGSKLHSISHCNKPMHLRYVINELIEEGEG